jgi:hypothetical protein
MDNVEHVALWVGLIASIVSIVLSGVAIAFAVMVDRGARAVTAQTIKSLQKIESDVERVSSDTRDLIKAGWDRMLGSVPLAHATDTGARGELAAGIAAEVKSELATVVHETDKATQEILERRLVDVIDAFESSLTTVPRTESRVSRRSVAVEEVRSRLELLSPGALAMAAAIVGENRHLEAEQYRELRDGPSGGALRELRRAGLLAPHVAAGKSDNDPPVYFFPGRLPSTLRTALPLVASPGREADELVRAELKRVGYSPDAA